LLLSFPAPALAAPPPLTLDDYLGAWELLIQGTGDSFRSGSLVLERAGGKLSGELVWRWGSVESLAADRVNVNDAGDLLVATKDWKHPLSLRRTAAALEGSHRENDDKLFTVFAARRVETADPSGTWDVEVRSDEGVHPATLVICRTGTTRFAAEVRTGEGGVSVEDLRLEGNRLRARIVRGGAGGEAFDLDAELRGDRLEGKLAPAAGGNAPVLRAVRQRAWGAPLQLLESSGLSGWRPRDPGRKFGWRCDGGILTNDPPGDVDIVSEAAFRDFKLHLEYKVSKGGNSGIYLRGRYEVQIVDDHRPADARATLHGNGAVYSRIAPARNVSREAETWQSCDVTLVDRYLTLVLNGEVVIDNARLGGITGGALDPWEHNVGPLMLQGDHGKVWYRNVVITPALPPDATAPKVADAHPKAPTGSFHPLFAGDGAPDGWAVRVWNDVSKPPPEGAVWKVQDGVLHGSDPRGTWLVSEREFGDFVLEFEWKLGAQGNSGCGLRFPPHGDPAFDGLELQMVDPSYYGSAQSVTPGELAGSLYKAVAPRVQAFRPQDWNRYRVVCVGPRVRVDLNGERVLDVNLDEELKPTKRHDGNDAPPLKDRPRRGHIGFQELSRGGGHVEIRNARILVLD
jgi:hypothetical protein